MKKPTIIATKIIALVMSLSGMATQSFAQNESVHMYHEMQHGFVLAADDQFASHLVANGHHSRQTEIMGQLIIDDQQEMEFYQRRKALSGRDAYFLLQAQNLDLPTLSEGQILTGHIVESKMGFYEPKNKIVRSATFRVQKVLLNISNPFFTEEMQLNSTCQSKKLLRQDGSFLSDLLNPINSEKKHCCDTGEKPCWWKC
jgi:hypothetical protein